MTKDIDDDPPHPPSASTPTVSFASCRTSSAGLNHVEPPTRLSTSGSTSSSASASASAAPGRRPSLAPLIHHTDPSHSHASTRSTVGSAISPSALSRVQSVNSYLSRVGSSFRQVLQWKERPAGLKEDVDPSVRAFHNKLINACRPALACFLATGISMVYPWSNKVTWFSITLSISGVGRNLGHTLEGIRQQWWGIAVAVPLCFLLKLFGASKIMTAFSVLVVSIVIAATSRLSEAAKKLCLIFLVWDVLIPVVSTTITIESLMVDLLKAVLGANIVCVFVMLFPKPHLAVWLCRWRLEELQEVMGRFLDDAVDSFCLEDDSEVHDLEDVIDEAAALLQDTRALLPDVKFELSVLAGCGGWCSFGCGRRRRQGKGKDERGVVYDRLVQYIGALEGQLENCRGMSVALSDLNPNATHSEFVRAMRPPLLELVTECRTVLQGICNHVCSGLRILPRRRRQAGRGGGGGGGGGGDNGDGYTPHSSLQEEEGGQGEGNGNGNGNGTHHEEDTTTKEKGEEEEEEDGVPAELFWPPKAALTRVRNELLRTRMRVVYGVELKVKPPQPFSTGTHIHNNTHIKSYSLASPTGITFERSAAAAEAAKRFAEESAKVGYMNLLPRNAFVLDLELYVEAFQDHHALCNSSSSSSAAAASAAAAAAAAASPRQQQQQQQQRQPPWYTKAWTWLCTTIGRLGPLGHGWKAWRQPCKVGLAILLSSIVVLADDAHLGLQTIWCPITVAQTMSSHPSSAFKSGANRVQGTVLGAVMGMAVTTWAPIHNSVAIVFVLTFWVFVCAFNRGSPTYGEVAVSAALTAPIVVVGPVVGSSGAVVRISQVILGTVIYVAVDNLLFPTRAKLLLRAQLCEAVQDFLSLCADGLATFASQVNDKEGGGGQTTTNSSSITEQAAAAEARTRKDTEAIRQGLQKEALYIALASDEPELWHKPFQREAYLKTHAIQLHIHRYLLMLHRSAASFPKELAEWDQAMLQEYEVIIQRLQRAVEAVFTEALVRLRSLKTTTRGGQHNLHGQGMWKKKGPPPITPSITTSASFVASAATDSSSSGSSRQPQTGVNVFQIRREFRDIQDTIDGLVTEYFSKDPVLTSLSFIVPLNGMIYSTRKMSAECVRFVQAVRELMGRENKIGKGRGIGGVNLRM